MDFPLLYMILLLVFWPLNSLLFCASDNRLVPGKPLSPGNILVSNDGIFAMGFFSPSKSTTKHFYVGVWYNHIPQHTVVWVANRDSPITSPSSATLALSNSSNLVVSEADGHVLWTTNITTRNRNSLPSSSAEAGLEDTGNFIIRSSGGTILWQSFDYPTDTLLPSMNFRISHKTHPLGRLISWKGPHDPSSGDFSYSADPNESLQRFIWSGSRPYRRSVVWTNYLTFGSYMESLKSTMYMTLHRIDDETYLSFGMPSGSVAVLMKMDYSGKMKIQIWDNNISDWKVLKALPEHECNTYGYCGPFGYCNNTKPIPTCNCLDGFEPNNMEDWTNGRFSQGCHRKEAPMCGRGDGFQDLPSMKIPDRFIHVRNRSFDECTAECTSNCSCVAYAYANMSTKAINGDDTRCLVWVGELIDTEKLIGEEGEILYLRFNGSNGNKRKRNIIKVALAVVASLLMLICIGVVLFCNCTGKPRNKEIERRLVLGDLSASDEISNQNLEFPFISFRKIIVATNNFSDSNMLGEGGFGKVYKGTLERGKEIAVKRLSKGSSQGVVEFRNEVLLITKLQHKNLVRLLGCSIQGDEKLLIYEYLPNKSLDAFLFDATRKSMLDWHTRFKIIKGVARGLLYLHQDSVLMIIHRDLKAGNILLDAKMNPKISDFGMARIFGGNQQQANTNRVVGTYGYMSPEYALRGVFSAKSDVYSFGVLILEIVSGLKIISTHLIMEFPNLMAYAWSLWMDGKAKDFVDTHIVESCSLDEVFQCIHAGLLCVQENPNTRPFMSSVLLALDDVTTTLPSPERPAYFAQRNYQTDGAGENTANSVNNLSVTTLGGR